MTKTTQDILQTIAYTGQAVIPDHKARELHAALDLIKAGICYRSSTHLGYFIIKFGRPPVTI
jgi:hypothetical protein